MAARLGDLGEISFTQTQALAAGTSTRLLDADDSRMSLLFSFVTGGAIVLSLTSPATGTNGVMLAAIGAQLAMPSGYYGDLVRRAWFGFSAAGGTLTIIGSKRTGYLGSDQGGREGDEKDRDFSAASARDGGRLSDAGWAKSLPLGPGIAQRYYQSLYNRLRAGGGVGPGDIYPTRHAAIDVDV